MHKKTKKIGIVIIILIISIVYLWDRVWVMYPPIFPEINYVWVYLTVNEKNVNNYDNLGWTKLHKAIYKKKYKTANLLIKRGADINKEMQINEELGCKKTMEYEYWNQGRLIFNGSDGMILSVERCSFEFNKKLIDLFLEKKIRIDLIKMLVRNNYYEKEMLNNYENRLKISKKNFKELTQNLNFIEYIKVNILSSGESYGKIDSKVKIKKNRKER